MARGPNPPSLIEKPVYTLYRKDDPARESLPKCFVDTYVDWAKKVTDAPVQYHVINSISILSAAATPYRFIETGYGIIKPNIWSMILAGTTITRKSTSMSMALKVLKECLPDFLMGTEGTPEGIFSELANRAGEISVFHRDEISGWIEQVTKKDYLAGLLEAFCKFYDGQEEKRILRSTAVHVKDPNLVIISGGIKSRMEELINIEHIRSGFIPRFIIVTGTTTADQIRPIGPPPKSNGQRDPREIVIEELYKIVSHIKPEQGDAGGAPVQIGSVIAIPKNPHVAAKCMEVTDEAWDRIRQVKLDAQYLAESLTNDDIYVPMLDRLSNSLIKIAMLIAASRRSLTVEYIDVVKAISYSDHWVTSAIEFASTVELAPHMTPWEYKVDSIYVWLKQQREPQKRADVMRRFFLSAKQMNEVEATLEDKDYIRVIRVNTRGSGSGRPGKRYEVLVGGGPR